ncbi:MAG: diguanylate cyclase domain-containing protein, partial [Gemmatimonadota bacterium]
VVSELLHQRRRLSIRLAYEDPLTGLANRRLIERDAAKALAGAEREGTSPAVVLFDLIRFKRVNDELGFVAGDRALSIVGRRIRANLRDADTVARVGGDEFAALLPRCDGEEEARAVTERMKATLRRPLEVAGQTVHLGARVGYALYPDDGDDFDELLTAADPGKRDGGDDSPAVPAPGGASPVGGLALESDLMEALEDGGQLHPFYQPVASLADDEMIGVEA